MFSERFKWDTTGNEISEQLREAAKEADWSVRWQDIDAFRHRAEKAW